MEEIVKIILKKHEQDHIFNNIDAIVKFVFSLSVLIVEEILLRKAQLINNKEKPLCPVCNKPLESKGWLPRTIITLAGLIKWNRRVWRCPFGCKIGQIVPFDDELGIKPNQRFSTELQKRSCLLAIFVPYQLASMLMSALTGVQIAHTTIFNWVQCIGKKAQIKLESELKNLSESGLVDNVEIDKKVVDLLMAIEGDGVLVPFRPNGGLPDGKRQWREVKVGIIARLGEKLTHKGAIVKIIVRKRVVAVLGTIEEFKNRIKLMALKERVNETKDVVWLSDGGPGYWGVFYDAFSRYAQGILDFYHGVQNVWKGAKAWLDGRTNKAYKWFGEARSKIKEGKVEEVIAELKKIVSDANKLPKETEKVLGNLIVYLEVHIDHMSYDKFKAMGFPIGSGMIESTCKWLIQQRFKGVGMRWSEDGFNNLLHLRLAWVNETFDDLFVENISPNS